MSTLACSSTKCCRCTDWVKVKSNPRARSAVTNRRTSRASVVGRGRLPHLARSSPHRGCVMVRQRHDPRKNLVGFVVGEVHYAVPMSVREISNPLDLITLPHAAREIIGVADVRGEVVPVVDLRIRFGLDPIANPRRNKRIVLRVASRLCARRRRSDRSVWLERTRAAAGADIGRRRVRTRHSRRHEPG